MISTLIETLETYKPSRQSNRALIESQLEALAKGPIYNETARAAFWNSVPHDRVDSLLCALIRVFVAEQRHYLQQVRSVRNPLEKPDIRAAMQLVVQFGLLLRDAGDSIAGCLDAVGEMLLDDDNQIYSVACHMLAGSSCRQFIPNSTLVAAFSKWGVHEYPFRLGIAAVKAASHDSAIVPALLQGMPKSSSLVIAVLTIIDELPIDKHEQLRIASEYLGSDNPEIVCKAMQAVAEIGINSPGVTEAMVAGFGSEHLWVRINASYAAGKLQAAPSVIIPKLIDMLSSDEEEAFKLQEAAIDGLAGYGPLATSALPALLAIRQSLAEEAEETGFGEELRRLENAIAAISGAPA